ncbi:MAG: M20 family metallopeptidase [Anaerolineales bacterium]
MIKLTPAEEQVLAYIEERRDQIVNFAVRLIETPSHNPPGNELAAAQVAERQLRQLGLNDIYIIEAEPQRANLVCTFDTGLPGPTLILNGHLDTKPPLPREAWETNPYQGVITGDKLFGLGSADMKGPNAALVFGLAAATHYKATHLKGKVLLILSADEEYMTRLGPRYLVEEKNIQADAVLIAEPIGVERSWECIPLISRGISCIRWKIHGTQFHSSTSDRVPAINASLEASRLMLFLEENLDITHPPTPLCPLGPTINLGATLKGGQAHAMVSGEADFIADIRTLPGMSKDQLAADIERATHAFRKRYPAASVTWEFLPGALAWTEPTQISQDEPLVEAIQFAARKVFGEEPPLGYFPGGTDAVWWQGSGGIPTIPGFGPGLLTNCHQPNEYIVIEEIIQAAKIYALAVIQYLREGSEYG